LEYTNLQYFLFKLGHVLNSTVFAILVAVILATAIVTYFFVQAVQEQPKFAPEKVRKLKRWQKISLIVFGSLVVILFIGRYFTDGVDGPDAVANDNKTSVIAKGQVIKINHRSATLAVALSGKQRGKTITIKNNQPPVMFGAPKVEKFDGTHIDKNQFDKINVGDYVKIQNHQFVFKYKNHAKFGNDKNTEKQIKKFNDNDVNGELIKTSSNPYSYLYGYTSPYYESELE